jgi:hypothetical protein
VPEETSTISDAVRRVRAEFRELPGLRVTRAQAARLWTLDSAVCTHVLSLLVDERFLVCADNDSAGQTSVYRRLDIRTDAPRPTDRSAPNPPQPSV